MSMTRPITVLHGRHVTVHEDGTHTFGVEDATKFPVGDWTNLYVPTDRLDEVNAALDAIGTGTLSAPGGFAAPRGPVSYDMDEIANRRFAQARDGYVEAIHTIERVADSDAVRLTDVEPIVRAALDRLRENLGQMLVADALGE